jgi:hypothetical protein
VVTAGSDGVGRRRIASVSAAAFTGSCRRLQRRRARLVVARVSSAPEVVCGGSTSSGRVQGPREVAVRRVSSDVCGGHARDVLGMPMPFWARVVRRLSSFTSTLEGLGWCRDAWWRVWAPGPEVESKGKRGSTAWPACYGMAMARPCLALP